MPEGGSARRIAARRSASSPCAWSSWRENAVDFREVLVAQAAGAGLEAQLVGDGAIARVGEVAAGGIELLLRVQDVDVDAHADLVAELVRVERALRRHQRLLQRCNYRDAVDDEEIVLPRGDRGGAPGVLQVFLRLERQRRGLALARVDRAALVERHRELQPDR